MTISRFVTSLVCCWRSPHEQGRLSFPRIRSFYPATFGQAITLAFGHLAIAKTALDSDENLTLVERAVYTYISIMQSYCGLRDSFNPALRKPKEEAKYRKQVQELYSFHPFLSRVKITNGDALELLNDTLYDSSSLLYLDPVYHPHAGMTGNNHYGADSWTVEQHQELVDLLIRARSKVILSGYDNEDYQKLIKSGWRKMFLGSLRVSISPKGKMGDEYVWINFDTDVGGHQF